MLHIYVDADACPVKAETFKVAARHELEVTVVANSWLSVPETSRTRLELVGDGFDAADDWIADHCGAGDIVITDDIPLASRCVKKEAQVLSPRGRLIDETSAGEALAKRDLMADLREQGLVTGGPRPFQPKDRSKYLQALETLIQSIRRKHR